jgi:hypothetical protein
MAASKVGRSTVVSGTGVPFTGSAYSALDAIGLPFAIPNATPNRGALLVNATMFESGSATAQIRAHFYQYQPSAVPVTGMTMILNPASGYLGYVDLNTWVPTHGSANMAQNTTQNLALRGDDQSRVWCQYQWLGGGTTFNADTLTLPLNLGLLQD